MWSLRHSRSTSDLGAAALALAALWVAGCGGARASAPAAPAAAAPAAAPAPAPAPTATADDGRPVFDHAAHLDRGPACLDCHPDAEKAARAAMPTIEMCLECHEDIDAEWPEEKRVTVAFTDPATKKPLWKEFTRQADEIVFSHGAHAAKKVPCLDCHAGMDKNRRTTAELRMKMDDCTSCHAERNAPSECSTCHLEIGLDRPPPNHDRLWRVRHGAIVRRGTAEDRLEDCTLCHDRKSCVDCHANELPRDHTQTWRVGPAHGLAAALDRQRCEACHRSDSCVGCHTSNAPRSHTASWGAPRARHCIHCHETPGSLADGGCATCHRGTPSHRAAPPKPDDHRPDQECLLCHQRLRHAVNSQDCNECHR